MPPITTQPITEQQQFAQKQRAKRDKIKAGKQQDEQFSAYLAEAKPRMIGRVSNYKRKVYNDMC